MMKDSDGDVLPVRIAEAFNGVLTPKDLLESEAHFTFTLPAREFYPDRYFFKISSSKYEFYAKAFDGTITMSRNGQYARVSIGGSKESSEVIIVTLQWTVHSIEVHCDVNGEMVNAITETPPIAPPNELIVRARKHNLLPTYVYESEEALREKVYSCLRTIDDKLSDMHSVSSFWDIQYRKNEIISRTPKHETDIHPVMSAMLYDQVLMASIEIVPEYTMSSGKLDFMFLGTVKDRGNRKVCVEFKNAHSDSLFHGLEKQLPAYMESKEAKYGAYCVLWYKGNYFNKPPDMTEADLFIELNGRRFKSKNPSLENTRVFIYDLSIKKSASK